MNRKRTVLEPLYPKYGAWTPWELVRNTELQAHPELLNLGLHVNKISRWFVCTGKWETAWAYSESVEALDVRGT